MTPMIVVVFVAGDPLYYNIIMSCDRDDGVTTGSARPAVIRIRDVSSSPVRRLDHLSRYTRARANTA